MSPREEIVDTLGDTCCFVIAVLLLPDMVPDPAIDVGALRSNVQVLWGTDQLIGRLAMIAAGKPSCSPNAEAVRGQRHLAGRPARASAAQPPAVPHLEIQAAASLSGTWAH